jgi:hypothetical protein
MSKRPNNRKLPIHALISKRSEELGLSAVELARRFGYKNVSKSLRRLEQLCQGDLSRSTALIYALPSALEVTAEVVRQAVDETKQKLEETRERAWREAFRPHAIILTERQRPEPLFVAAVIGVERLLRLDLDHSRDPATYVTQARTALKQRLTRWKGVLPAFGRPVGLIVNYSPDSAVRFDLDGSVVEVLDAAHRLGSAQFCIDGRAIFLQRPE